MRSAAAASATRGAIRLFAPSETKAARSQLGSGRFKTDDRDCAALTYLARQGVGRRQAEESSVEELRAAVRHRRGWSRTGRRPSSGSTTSSMLCARDCPHPMVTGDAGAALPIESPYRAGGAGLRGGIRGTTAIDAVTDRPIAGQAHQGDRRVLVPALARVSPAAARCRRASRAAGPGPAALSKPADGRRRDRRRDHALARPHATARS